MAYDSETDDSKDRVFLLYHSIDRERLKRGDHIYAYRMLGVYSHHGIYIGKELGIHTVIHFTGTTKSTFTAKIRKASLDEFLRGCKLKLVTYNSRIELCATSHTLESSTKTEVLFRAEYFADNPEEWPDYNLLTNNCEQFCIYCKTGKSVDHINSDIEILDQAKDLVVRLFAGQNIWSST